MNFNRVAEFDRDLKRLGKKWRSLESDLVEAERQIAALYIERDDIDLGGYRRDFFASKKAAILHTAGDTEVVKMRLDVADLGRSDKVRIIFVAVKTENTIRFIELFAKNDKEREDTRRIRKYLS